MTTQEALDATALRFNRRSRGNAAIRAFDEGSVELVLPFVGGRPPAPMDRSDARIQEAWDADVLWSLMPQGSTSLLRGRT
jgi:hypothetical protein